MLWFIVGAVAVAGACLLNSESDNEKKRQKRLEENYREYQAASNAEHEQILRNRDECLEQIRQKTAHELWQERQNALAERKARNRKNFDVLMEEWHGQFDDRTNLLEQIQSTIESLKAANTREQATELRQTSMQVILSEAFEALARQKAYLAYLKRYKKAAEKIFERTSELLEPFQMTLPEYWTYTGKIIGFNRDDLLSVEFEKSIHRNVDCKFFCEDSAEISRLFPNDEIIYCLVESYDNKTYTNKISCAKGMFIRKLEQSPNIKLEATVKRHEQNEQGYLVGYILDAEGIEVTLRKKYCKDRRNLAPVGSRKFIHIMNFDRRELKWANGTERIEDCLSVERFRNVPLLIKDCDYPEFIDAVRKRNAGNTYDEWYIAPIADGETFSRTKYKCQLGQKLVFQASFTEEELPKLLFEKILDDAEMIAANDIFVALDASLRTCYVERKSDVPQEFWQESLNLFIYLNAEFLRQQRIKFNQENVLFLNQWCAIMRRLIYAKESGGFKTVDILEQVDDERLLTSAEGANTLKAFYNWQVHRHDAEPSFFIRGMDDKKIFVSFEDDFKVIKTSEPLDEDFLELVGYRVDVHVHEFPYPEIMQWKALEDFRRSSIQNSALKECIVDLSHMNFKDSGRRPKSIKNHSLLRNKNQMLAVIRSLAVENFFMIQGPPGTGKTTVIKEIIWQQLRLEPESKILVVSQANVAVDNVLRGLPPMGIPRSAIVRCGNDDKISDEMQDFSLDKQVELYREKLNEPCRADLMPYRKIWRDMMNNADTQGFIGEYLLKNFSVTGATCVGLAKKHFGLDRLSFDLVIADEAGKALPGELLLPINRAKKIIIIGDHKQLPPVIDPAFHDETKVNIKDIVEDESRDKFFSTSLFEKLYETCPNDNKCMLDIQFRMPTRIGEMVSNLFYGGRLNSATVCREKAPLFFGNNIFFLNMDDDPEYHETQDVTADGKSGPYNESEIKITAALLKKLRENFSERIAVITPYKNQNKKLRQRLRGERLKNVVVNTIDAFQGDEAEIVIYCTTRAITPTKYFSDAARLNVAFSRARNLLIIIGALNYFYRYKSGHLMRKVADYLEERGRIVNAKDFFSAEIQFSFNALPPAEKFHADNNETPLTAREIESYLPAREEDSRLTCRSCGGKFESNELLQGFCPDCLFDGEHYKCGNCGADMLYTNAAQYVNHQPKEELCEDCKIIWRHTCKRCGVNEVVVRARDLKNNPQKTEKDFPYCRNCLNERNKKIPIICAACGCEFTISRGRVEDLRAQGKTSFKYCQDCWREDVTTGYCKSCRRPISLKRAKLHDLKAQGKTPPDYCQDCFKARNEKISITCAACGKEFFISRGLAEDLRAQGKTPSKYCQDCWHDDVTTGYCKSCGRPISFKRAKLHELRAQGKTLLDYCQDCWNEKIPVGSCKICGQRILYSRAKLHQLREKYGLNYSPPRKCDKCK